MKRLSASIALGFSLVLFLVGVFSVSVDRAFAATTDNISGWAWSSGIGWISFNCTNESTCGTSNYGVNMDSGGNLTGYAWSSAVGWIQFGGLSGFPTGSGTQATNVQLNGNNLKGWARALSNGGGWDGWISFSGAGPSYGVNLSGTNFVGYAWGGDVVGWILFDINAQYPGLCTTNCGVTLSGDASLDVKSGGVSIVGGSAVTYGTVPRFEWTLTNVPGGTSCSVSKTSSGGTAFTTQSGLTSSGWVDGSALTNASYTYNITCVSGSTTLVNKSVSFTVAPQPAGFSLGNAENVKVQVLPSGAVDSETKAVFVTPVGGYSNPVSISISSYPSLPASTTMQYSFNSGTSYSSNPSTQINSPYSSGIGFRVRVTRLTGAPPFTSNYTVRLQATGSGATTVYKDMIVTPTTTTPSFIEI